MSDLSQVGFVAFLIAINALFAGSEMAMVTLRPAQIERLAARGRSGRVLARLTGDPNRFLATIQIGITLAGFLASATAAVSLAEPVVPLFAFLGGTADAAAIVSVTLVLTFFTLVFGELAPKRIAMQHPEGWALAVAIPLDLLATATRPAVLMLSASTNLVVRLTGGDPQGQRDDVSEEELRDMISTQVSLTEAEKQIITGAFEIGDRTLRQVLVPRHMVMKLPIGLTASEAITQLLDGGHSRAPVYRDSPDEIVGVVWLHDILRTHGPIESAVTPLPTFPESANVLRVLRDLQQERQQMAMVVDEFGGFEGIVTVEDLIEEIVGEIYDDYDRDITSIVRHEDGSLELPGTFPAHDLMDIGIVIDDGPYTKLAGFMLTELGRIPETGEYIDGDGWRLTATKVTATTIVTAEARPRVVE